MELKSAADRDYAERMKVAMAKGEYKDEIISESHIICVNTRTEYIYRWQGDQIISERVIRGGVECRK